jgi:hypothetical protein
MASSPKRWHRSYFRTTCSLSCVSLIDVVSWKSLSIIYPAHYVSTAVWFPSSNVGDRVHFIHNNPDIAIKRIHIKQRCYVTHELTKNILEDGLELHRTFQRVVIYVFHHKLATFALKEFPSLTLCSSLIYGYKADTLGSHDERESTKWI